MLNALKALFFASILVSSGVVLPLAFAQNYSLTLSPLMQLKRGVLPEFVACSDGFILVKKISENSVACVRPQTEQKLVERGWGTLITVMKNFEDYRQTAFTMLNVSQTEAKNFQKVACGDVTSYTLGGNLVTEKAGFPYLEPKYQVFRIGCSRGPGGIVYEYFAMLKNNETVHINTNININSDVFQIKTPWQAIEYVALYYVNMYSDRSLIASAADYKRFCDRSYNATASPLAVVTLDDYYLVKMNVVQYTDTGPFCGDGQFKVSKDGNYKYLANGT